MEKQVFILTKTKPFRHHLKLFLKSNDGKTEQRMCVFTTEHKVAETERMRNARTKPAEYITSDEREIDALYRDTGYGKTFVHVDDPKGERKRVAFKVTHLDAKKIALQNLFTAAGIDFDGKKDVAVLEHEYQIFMTAKSGKVIAKSTATSIPAEKVDVKAEIDNQVQEALKAYEEKYGEPMPESFKSDKGLLSAILSDANFDAKGYIESKGGGADTGDDLPNSIEELRELYFNEFDKNVANIKKNDAEWIKAQIRENRVKE